MVSGEYFEAGSSRGQPASLACRGDSLELTAGGLSRIFDPKSLGISQRLARLPRRIHFSDGGMFTTPDNEQADEMLRSVGRVSASSWISFFETGWRWTLLALLVIPVVLYLLFSFGMPLVATPMASMVPDTVKNDLDRKTIELLDKRVFQPSKLGLDRQAELTRKLSRLSLFKKDTKLIFRDGHLMGANALALPGGTIIFTDQIVELAEYDGELAAVYVHEVGHVVNNHSLRKVMQTTGVSFVLGWMLGDLSMITDIVLVGAPVLLQNMAYSREFEREADAYSMLLLPVSGYSKNCFGDIMQKLSDQSKGSLADFPDYLSSHPPTQQRIDLARSDQPCSEERQRPGSKKPKASTRRNSQRDEFPGPVRTMDIPPPVITADPDMTDPEEIVEGNRNYSPVSKAAPKYPQEALFQGIEGYCVIEYTVTRLGTVTEPTVVADQCSSPLFIPASIEASLKFRYRPRIADFEAVDVTGVQNRFTYKIISDQVNDEKKINIPFK